MPEVFLQRGLLCTRMHEKSDFKEGKESKLIFYAYSTMKVTAGRTDFKEDVA